MTHFRPVQGNTSLGIDDTEESWTALYRRIEEFDESAEQSVEENQPHRISNAGPVTYDLLLDPERVHGAVGDFFAVLMGQD